MEVIALDDNSILREPFLKTLRVNIVQGIYRSAYIPKSTLIVVRSTYPAPGTFNNFLGDRHKGCAIVNPALQHQEGFLKGINTEVEKDDRTLTRLNGGIHTG